jgi:multiple sugar transport system ATP-binding protein
VGLSFEGGAVTLPEEKGRVLSENEYMEKEVLLGIRPADLRIAQDGNKGDLETELLKKEMDGEDTLLNFRVAEIDCVAKESGSPSYEPGDTIALVMDAGKIHVFDRETEKSIVN